MADHAQVLSPEAYCFIIDLDSDSQDRLSFQLMPEVITDTKSANYSEIPILGRSIPFLGYANSSSRAIGLSLQFVALNREGQGQYTPTWVRQQVSWLESKVYPVYADGFTFPPHRLLLSIAESVGMQVVMTSCSTSWTYPWAVSESGVQAFRAQVDCQFQEYGMNDGERPFGFDDAIEGAHNSFGSKGSNAYVDIPVFVSGS
jgi:hypothetical protein